MAQIRKVEGQIEIKTCADKFFDVWAHKTYQVSKLCPDKCPKIELHEGNWHTAGSVTTWNYITYGKSESIKKIVEEIDENNKSVTYNLIDEYILKNYYKNFKSKIQVIPKGESCIVKWSFNYEKLNEDAPEANIYVEFLLSCAKDIDAQLCRL